MNRVQERKKLVSERYEKIFREKEIYNEMEYKYANMLVNVLNTYKEYTLSISKFGRVAYSLALYDTTCSVPDLFSETYENLSDLIEYLYILIKNLEIDNCEVSDPVGKKMWEESCEKRKIALERHKKIIEAEESGAEKW